MPVSRDVGCGGDPWVIRFCPAGERARTPQQGELDATHDVEFDDSAAHTSARAKTQISGIQQY
jgi:hypothetical protein